MSALRRTAVLIGLTLAVIVGSSIPASATFTDSVTRSAVVVTSGVTAPTNLDVSVTCTATELHAKVTWTRSSSPRINGYVIAGTINNDPMVFRAEGNVSSYTYKIPRLGYAYSVPVAVTVTTDTEYRWTATSSKLQKSVTTC